MIRIITDSCSDLSHDIREQHKIEMLPLTVFIDNNIYKDGQDISTKQLFDLVEKNKILPKTSAVSTSEFINSFSQTDDDILFIGISSKLSATVPNAQSAAKELNRDNIAILDSFNLSTGIGLLVLEAAEMRDRGCSLDEIVADLSTKTQKINTSFTIDRLDYLYMGGRCSAMSSIVGSILQIRPVIEVRKDGTLGVKEKIRGSRKKALQSMIVEFEKNVPVTDLHRLFITHTGCDDDAQYISNEIQKLAQIDEILITTAGATVSSHCGQNTIGIMFLQK